MLSKRVFTVLSLLVVISWLPFSRVIALEDPVLDGLQKRLKADLDTIYSAENLRPEVIKKLVAILSSIPQQHIQELLKLDDEDCAQIVEILKLDEDGFLALDEKGRFIAPKQSIETISDNLQNSIEEVIRLQKNLKTMEQILSELEDEFPIVKIGDKITVESKSKGKVTGRLNKVIGNNNIVIGTKFISVVELSEMDQSRIFEDKHKKLLKSEAEKRFEHEQFILENDVKDELKKRLPAALLKAGYLPFPKAYKFDFTQGRPEAWGTRQQIVDACINTERNDYVRGEMNKYGYELIKGYGWIKKKQVNNYQVSAGVFNDTPEQKEVLSQGDVEKMLLHLCNEFSDFLKNADQDYDRNEGKNKIWYTPDFTSRIFPLASRLNKQTIVVKNGQKFVSCIVLAAVDWEYAVKKKDLAQKYKDKKEFNNYNKCIAESEAQLRKANYNFHEAQRLCGVVKAELESIWVPVRVRVPIRR